MTLRVFNGRNESFLVEVRSPVLNNKYEDQRIPTERTITVRNGQILKIRNRVVIFRVKLYTVLFTLTGSLKKEPWIEK